jgi:hypothetical protein
VKAYCMPRSGLSAWHIFSDLIIKINETVWNKYDGKFQEYETCRSKITSCKSHISVERNWHLVWSDAKAHILQHDQKIFTYTYCMYILHTSVYLTLSTYIQISRHTYMYRWEYSLKRNCGFFLFLIYFLLLYWGYVVTFTEVLTVYHNWIQPLHHAPLSPLLHF